MAASVERLSELSTREPWLNDGTRLRREQRRFYPGIIARLEVARGPDRALDLATAHLLGLADRTIAGEAQRCRDGSPVPRFTQSREEVEVHLRRSFPGWTWTVQDEPHPDAQIWTAAAGREPFLQAQPQRLASAWMERDGRTHMDHPPANAAIALTLAMLRASIGIDG